MYRNTIQKISDDKIEELINNIKTSSNSHIVEVNGQEIQSWDDYIRVIECAFRLPNKWTNNLDGYNDWMRDLEWLEKDSYVLIIRDFDSFLRQDCLLKKR